MKNRCPAVKILDIPFFPHSKKETFLLIEEHLQRRENLCVFTPNSEILSLAHQNADQKQLLLSADLLLPDGIGVLLAARLMGTPLPERITGIDMGEWLLQYASGHSLSVFLLGGKSGVADLAKKKLTARIPNLRICGTHHGYFDQRRDGEENQRVLQEIRRLAPDLLFVCLGYPAQERWILENTPHLPSLRLSIGLGGALDVWSGNLSRAPKLFQVCGLEWLWRTAQDPKRIRRLSCLPRFLWAVLLH